MKKLVVTLIVVFGFGGVTLAADLPEEAPALPPPAPERFDWTGFYLGGHLGGAWVEENRSIDLDGWNGFGLRTNIDSKTLFVGGGQVGYNFQADSFVFGVEADITYLGYSSGAFDPPPSIAGDTRQEVEADWLGTLRARLGYAFNSTLLYATGGLAFSDLEYSVRDSSTAPPGVGTLSGSSLTKDSDFGWTLGGGAEFAFTENWTVKGEYLYVHFDGKRPCGVSGGGGTFCFRFDDTKMHLFRIGVNYIF